MTRSLLWIDCSAGAAVGVGMLALHVPMAHWYELPVGLLLGMGAANLVYASFSLSLARDPDRSLGRVSQLAVANMAWGLVCLALTAMFRGEASWLGIGHLVLEALFVGGLGLVEWRVRHRMTGMPG